MKSYQTLQKMIDAGITAVVRGDTFEEAATIAKGCIEGGVTSIEVTFTTPMRRFGDPEDLLGTLLWLADENMSGFVTGITVPVDGGFMAYSGV
ncbi:D-mannonate oxidoreductase [Alkalihalophilus pseudofirmus OF4]|uniref:D-mannonate oxidoreductase n=1 Tax=Alkalihalophilus pseudofirmus (strain ATCC BAA-2126 / JCM 17055 / OF4) TaxID=398511 RepID=D3G0C0_ALKPO|nr:D-mannonate oxidoreductase [Alkalihalophilus pseudofirmus OF4]